MATNVNRIYDLLPDQEVKLNVTIGNAQLGTSTIMLDGDILEQYELIDQFTFDVPGDGADLHKKELLCISSIKDSSPEHDETSIIYHLTGGIKPLKILREETAPKDGAVVNYYAVFEFYTYGV